MTNNNANLWWGPPKNFSDRKYERKISWLELFYDLVYVAAISQLTHHIGAHPSWMTLSFSFLLFSLVFWSWVNGSQYYDLHGNDSIRTRLFTFWQMLGVAAVAITIQDAFEGRHQGFAVSFAVIQSLITYLWWSVGFYDPSHRVFSKFYTFNYVISLILIILSVFTSFQTATLLFVLVLLFNVTPPLTASRTSLRVHRERGEVFSASATIVERFGLFTIIVLAESILGTVTGVAEVKDKGPEVWIAFILAILISFLIWSLYFDMTSEQETKVGYWYYQWLIFLHLPLLFSIIIVGAGIKLLLMAIDSSLPQVQWMFCIAISTILLMIFGLTRIMLEEEEDRSYIVPVSRLLLGIGVFILFIPLFGQYFNNMSFLFIISVILFAPVFIGVRAWVQYKFFRNK